MVSDEWVVNSSPLILLGNIAKIDLLPEVGGKILVPRAVVDEIKRGDGGEGIVEGIEAEDRFEIKDNVNVPRVLPGWDLGDGETQVIAIAMENGAGKVVLDDREARRCAKSLNLPVIGTLGLVARAKEKGVIQRAKPVIQELCEKGLYAGEDIVKWILNEVGE